MNAVEEIIEHHRFIQAWLRGTAALSDLGSSFLDMHTPDFTWYGPDGSVMNQRELASACQEIHGTAPDVDVEIHRPRLLLNEHGMVVATYEEHQRTSGSENARLSLVVFAPAPAARHRLRWRHLHETWITSPQFAIDSRNESTRKTK